MQTNTSTDSDSAALLALLLDAELLARGENGTLQVIPCVPAHQPVGQLSTSRGGDLGVTAPQSIVQGLSVFSRVEQAQYVVPHHAAVANDVVQFKGKYDEIILLKEMLEKKFKKEGPQEPWTNATELEQKFFMRVEVQRGQGGTPCYVALPIYCRTNGKKLRPVSKSTLGYNISKALHDSKEFMDHCATMKYKFEDLALLNLVKVSKGSWQPTLYLKVSSEAEGSSS